MNFNILHLGPPLEDEESDFFYRLLVDNGLPSNYEITFLELGDDENALSRLGKALSLQKKNRAIAIFSFEVANMFEDILLTLRLRGYNLFPAPRLTERMADKHLTVGFVMYTMMWCADST